MKAIVFNNLPSKIHQQHESVALRACYLLSDTVATAGNSTYVIWMEEHSEEMSLKNKIRLLGEHFGDEFNSKKFLLAIEQAEKIKHMPPKQLIAHKKLVASIHNLYKAMIQETMQDFNGTGLKVLKDIIDGEVFGVYSMHDHDKEYEDKQHVPASKLLRFELPEPEKEPVVFCLPPEFFSDLWTEKFSTHTDSQAKQVNQCWLHKCFTFPNINQLSALELTALRKQLETTGLEFRKQTDVWFSLCETGNAENSVQHFQKNILSHAASLQAAIAQSQLLKNIAQTQRSSVKLEVWMGEMPVTMLWKFYETAQVIDKPTVEKLNQALQTEPQWHNRVPVMVLKSPPENNQDHAPVKSESQNVPEIQSVRKSISVD